MKKIFEEFGGVIVTVVSVVALISLVVFLMKPGGVVEGAFGNLTRSFAEKTGVLLGAVSPGNPGQAEQPGQGEFSIILDSPLSQNRNNPSLVDSSSLLLSGKVANGNGAVTLTVNGADAAVRADGTWSATITLPVDEIVEVMIVASDKGSQSGVISGYVLYTSFETVTLNSGYFDEIGYDRSMSVLEIPCSFQKADGTWCKIIAVGYGAFERHTNLVSVKIPEGVTSLDSNAFYGCTGLTSVGLPGSGCSVELPNSLTKVSYSAFEKCSSLASVVIPRNVADIYSSAFEDCSQLAHVRFEENSCLEDIYEDVFANCSMLVSVGPVGSGCSVELPDGLEALYRDIFTNCSNITRFILPANISEITADAFAGLTGLQAIEVSPGNEAYCVVDGVLYTKDMETLVRYPAGKQGSSFSIPESVDTIEKYGFAENVYLRSIVLSSNIRKIGQYAFAGCSNLEGATIPASVTNIGPYAFSNCNSLNSVLFEKTTGWTASYGSDSIVADVSDAADNAANMTGPYLKYYWYAY